MIWQSKSEHVCLKLFVSLSFVVCFLTPRRLFVCVNGVFFGGQMAEGVIRLQELMRKASVCVCETL